MHSLLITTCCFVVACGEKVATTNLAVNKVDTSSAGATETTLLITAEPWADIRVDGRDVGGTPARIAVPAGRHRIEFRYPAGPTAQLRTKDVEIRVGETLSVSEVFRGDGAKQ